MIAVGTGNDWVRTFGISNRYQDAVKAGETGDFRSERKAAAAKYRLPPL